jgi:non-ribosomal peptide synthetase component F
MMIHDWNETAQDLPYDRCLHEHFSARAAAIPNAPAMRHRHA